MDDDAGMYGEFGQVLEPMTSGSKRKRTLEWTMTVPKAGPEVEVHAQPQAQQQTTANDDSEHTPKRSRPSSSSPKQESRSIRRKGARYGLSSLNKRHAEAPSDNVRPSRFQEGSMSDKPSAQPPSLFTRDRSNPGAPALADVDHLMTRYHQENEEIQALPPPLPRQTAPAFIPTATVSTHSSVPASVSASSTNKPSGLFRFGKMFASSFSPMNVWESFSKTWKESKEDLTVRNIEENRKRQQQALEDDKVMYEQAYQELKKSGQFNFTVVPNKALTSPRAAATSQFPSPTRKPLTSPRHTPYQHLRPNVDHPHSRDNSLDSTDLAPPPQLAALFKRDNNNTPSEASQSPDKPLKARKSFFTLRGASLRAPSLSSLKRGRSTTNLGDAFTSNPTPSAPLSPEKLTTHLTLQSIPRSQSKKDLNKQVKLSKRVSDLESKLADARRELNDAITNASPLPPLPSRYEKFTPTSKSKFTRARFGFSGGKLPSLPSERLLSPENLAVETPSLSRPRPEHTQSFDLTHLRESGQLRDSAVVIDTPRSEIQSFLPVDYNLQQQDPLDPASLVSSDPADQSEVETHPSLDARLKTPDTSVKAKGKKPVSSKKRKSTATKDDQAHKPPMNEQEDESESVKDKPKKKRKSTGTKAINVEAANEKPGSEDGQGRLKSSKTNTKQQEIREPQVELAQPDDDNGTTGARASMETLDPIHEEDLIVVASRVASRTTPSYHDAETASMPSRTGSLKSILVNKHETGLNTSHAVWRGPSSTTHPKQPCESSLF